MLFLCVSGLVCGRHSTVTKREAGSSQLPTETPFDFNPQRTNIHLEAQAQAQSQFPAELQCLFIYSVILSLLFAIC